MGVSRATTQSPRAYDLRNLQPQQLGARIFPWLEISAEGLAGLEADDIADYTRAVGDQRRYASLVDWAAVVSEGIIGDLYVDAEVDEPLVLSADARIRVHGIVTITAAAAVDNVLVHDGEIDISGGRLVLDGQDQCAYAGFHSTNKLPHARGVTITGCTHGFNCGSDPSVITSNDVDSGSVGYLEDCLVHNAIGAAYSLRGDPNLKDTQLTVVNCRTTGSLTGSMGSNVGGTMRFLYHDRVTIIGGDWDGHEDCEVTCGYQCNFVEVHGGVYRNTARGPTVGRETARWVIDGAICKDIKGVALSGDVTDGSGATEVLGVISNCVAEGCEIGCRTTGSGIKIHGLNIKDSTSTSGDLVVAGEATNVTISDCSITRSGTDDFTPILLVESSKAHIDFDSIRTNSTRKFAYRTGTGCEIVAGANAPRTITANDDLRVTDKVLIVDATAGAVDVDLPTLGGSVARLTGFRCEVLQLPAANGMTFSFDGGNTGGETINGAGSISIPPNPSGRPRLIKLICANGVTNTWYALGAWPGGTGYTVTNSSADRSYDADDSDAAAVTELNDVVATMLSDLGWR